VPAALTAPTPARAGEGLSTQAGFGRLLTDLGREHPTLAERIVTASPDVTVSTNLGGWVNRRGIFDAHEKADIFRDERISSVQSWAMSPSGQHIELGIAESNLFTLLAALGLSGPLFGARLLPIGTVYDPFVARGLDALNYACYQDARFILAGTPAGVTLAPEGGAHQSIYTPLIGMGQPGLTSFEPAFVDELTEIVRWSFEHLQAEDGGAVYLRLSTRAIAQPARPLEPALRDDIIAGAYWLVPPDPGTELAIIASGPVIVEAMEAHQQLLEDLPGTGLMVVTSPDRLHRQWTSSTRTANRTSHVERLLSMLPDSAGLVTVIDGHPATLSWMAAVRGHTLAPLGVERFGQSGDIVDLYAYYGLDADAIVGAAARLCVGRATRT
jgi:pyruvate dehydrogenase E1 component